MPADGPPGVRYVRQVSLPPGTRVVVRHRVAGSAAGEVTDVLGVLEPSDPSVLAVRRRDGALVEVPLADVVAAKAVPPPPERRR